MKPTAVVGVVVGVVVGLLVAAAAGYGVARWTASSPVPDAVQVSEPEKPTRSDALSISAADIEASQIKVERALVGAIEAQIVGSAVVNSPPDAEAVLTAKAAGTVVRINVRIGDEVKVGSIVALIESRDAAAIAAETSAAAARLNLASRQFDRERGLFEQGVSPRADLETAQANLAVARAEVRRAASAAAAARVTGDGRTVAVAAPIAGRVTAVPGNLGSFVQADTPLLRVIDPRRLQVEASLPAADAERVRAADRAQLTTPDGRSIEGQVRSVIGVVDAQSRQATVVIRLPASSTLLIPGQWVHARIFASVQTASLNLNVPQDAVQTINGREVVFVRTAEGFRVQPVRVVRRNQGRVEISDGFAPGEQIATDNAFLLKAELGKDTTQ